MGIAGALVAALPGVVAAATIGTGAAALAIVVGFLTANFFFTTAHCNVRVTSKE